MNEKDWRTERWVPMRDFERVVEAARLAVEEKYYSMATKTRDRIGQVSTLQEKNPRLNHPAVLVYDLISTWLDTLDVAVEYGKCKDCPLSPLECGIWGPGEPDPEELRICDIAEYIWAAYLLGKEEAKQ